jgi:hypothetical protein
MRFAVRADTDGQRLEVTGKNSAWGEIETTPK